jgi:hypothetical protein
MAFRHCHKGSGERSIKSAVILDGNSAGDYELTSKHVDMLNLSENVMGGEHSGCEVEVPRLNFTTQGVSSRQDVD